MRIKAVIERCGIIVYFLAAIACLFFIVSAAVIIEHDTKESTMTIYYSRTLVPFSKVKAGDVSTMLQVRSVQESQDRTTTVIVYNSFNEGDVVIAYGVPKDQAVEWACRATLKEIVKRVKEFSGLRKLPTTAVVETTTDPVECP